MLIQNKGLLRGGNNHICAPLDELDQLIIESYAKGIGPTEIAMKVGCTKNVICGKARRLRERGKMSVMMSSRASGYNKKRKLSKPRISVWNEERVDLLKTLYTAKASHKAIGDRLGLSAGAVSSKVHRLIASGDLTHNGQGKDAGAVRKSDKWEGSIKNIPDEPDKPNIDIMDLELHHCRWPTGKGTFCGQKNSKPYGYCPEHHARSVLAKRPRIINDKYARFLSNG